MKADTICKCMTKEGIAKSLHVCINRARLTACEVGVFLREITPKNMPTPPFKGAQVHHPKTYFREIMIVVLLSYKALSPPS